MNARAYLILKGDDKIFDLYEPWGQSYTGIYVNHADTLTLYRKQHYYRQSSSNLIDSIASDIMFTIPLVFLIKDGYLEEITDYMSYPELVPAFEGGYLFHYGDSFRKLKVKIK